MRLLAGSVALTVAVVGISLKAQSPSQLRPLPLIQLDDRALAADLDNRAFTLTFPQPIPVRDLLLMLVRGTSLSIVADPEVAGTFIGDLKNVTVRQALGVILPQTGLDYAIDGSLIRVFRREPETRLYDVNYIATSRTPSNSVGGGLGRGDSYARVTTSGTADLFSDLMQGVQSLLSDRGKASVDRKAGLVQVTDFPERLERVATYVDAVRDRMRRQVQLDARVLEVELNDVEQLAIDWRPLIEPGDTIAAAAIAPPPAPVTLRIADVPRFMARLAAQGKVSVLASTRVVALNNQPAVVRATTQTTIERSDAVDEHGVTIGVTPQIGSDRIVMLSVSPLVSVRHTDAQGRPLPVTSVRESDVLARVADGETIVLAGLTRQRETRERKNAGIAGGWFGRSTVVTRKHVELVILLTATIVPPPGGH